MNNDELNKLLRSARLPDRSEEYWNEFPDRVVAEIQRGKARPQESRGRFSFPLLAWGGAFAAVCLALFFVLGQGGGRHEEVAGKELLQNEKLIHEVMAMFPGRLRAVVKNEQGLDLVLSDQPDVPRSTPLWVKVCRGESCVTAVTFSGQDIRLAGEDITVLSDAKGGVILEGDRFAWASSNPELAPAGLKIQAHPLELMAMR